MGGSMSNIILTGDTSGTLNIAAPLVAGTNTQTLVAATGTLAPLISGTAVATTSGTSIDFTGIPSWVKRISVIFNGISTNSTDKLIVQIGSGSLTTSGYVGRGSYILNPNGVSVINVTAGLAVEAFGSGTETRTGIMTIALLGSNTYVSSSQVASNGNLALGFGNSTITLSGAIDRLRVTTIAGTDIFDAGSVNILYE
jgi:hypothetical protein